MRAALFAFSRGGCATARRILAALPDEAWMCYTMPRFEEPGFLPLDKAVYGACFSSMDALVFVGACGIAVREIAPYVKSKKTDPAVVCIDEAGRCVIPLLSGHIGGANALAVKLAEKLGATAVVTTATDVRGKFSVDAWAAQHGCAISDMALAKVVSAAILEEDIPLCSQFPLPAPLPEGTFAGESGPLGVFIGWRTKAHFAPHPAAYPSCAAGRHRLPAGHLRRGGGACGADSVRGKRTGHGGHLRRLFHRPEAGRGRSAGGL